MDIENDLKEIALKIHDALFAGEKGVDISGEYYEFEPTSQKKLRKLEIGDFMFIEQNPSIPLGRKSTER
ncbi:hypothetical protein GF325_08325 [Candidatus Bathyarchaeota archaeon]|nr:hypothetical protein [Candidatus Bathyarchaeota archaeon]